eukprot:GHVU01150192.1.p1 GENE.GHVU01150192.1~~GHVU01150192.1.p1  ORF type:complete len:289 (+),score=34.89 GHVU01150192.1:104-970(+)
MRANGPPSGREMEDSEDSEDEGGLRREATVAGSSLEPQTEKTVSVAKEILLSAKVVAESYPSYSGRGERALLKETARLERLHTFISSNQGKEHRTGAAVAERGKAASGHTKPQHALDSRTEGTPDTEKTSGPPDRDEAVNTEQTGRLHQQSVPAEDPVRLTQPEDVQPPDVPFADAFKAENPIFAKKFTEEQQEKLRCHAEFAATFAAPGYSGCDPTTKCLRLPDSACKSDNCEGCGVGPASADKTDLDDDLSKLLMSWYYAGYYTGRHSAFKEMGVVAGDQSKPSTT